MHTEEMNGSVGTREAVERGLAVVGFIALVGCGIWLAIYSSRYVPTTVDRLGAAAVVLSSFFTPGDASLSVVPTASTTIPFGSIAPTTKPAASAPTPKTSAPKAPGASTSGVYPVGTSTPRSATTTPYGLPDLKTDILAVGFLASTSTDSFAASSSVSASKRPAVKFTISNIGTNIAASGWHFSAAIPTQSAYVFYSPAQPALAPGDSIEYTLGFDQASVGVNRSISLNADSDTRVAESVENNNSATASVTILSN